MLEVQASILEEAELRVMQKPVRFTPESGHWRLRLECPHERVTAQGLGFKVALNTSTAYR